MAGSNFLQLIHCILNLVTHFDSALLLYENIHVLSLNYLMLDPLGKILGRNGLLVKDQWINGCNGLVAKAQCPFILSRLIEQVAGSPGDRVVKKKLSARSDSVTLRQLNSTQKRGYKVSKFMHQKQKLFSQLWHSTGT